MRWIGQVTGAARMLLMLCGALAATCATGQESQPTANVGQLEEIVAAQQLKIERLEARLNKLEETSRILGFDRYVAAAKSSAKGPVQPSGKPVPTELALEVGRPVLVQWKNSWWNGSVIEQLAGGNVRIHYEGWDAKYDEVVPRSRLQFPAPQESLAQPIRLPAPAVLGKAEAEVREYYAAAHPEIQEYILWTARTFGRNGMWLNADAFAGLPDAEADKLVQDLAALLEDGEYGRHLCPGLARAGAFQDDRLVPGLMKVAGYREESDYDCRPKWMAVAALARQESSAAVPLLVSLVDHGNQNTRMWARAALARKTGQDFAEDKQAWAKWWQAQGHAAIDDELLTPWQAPPASGG